MSDLTKYNPEIAWTTIASSVRLLTRETGTDVATFRIDVKAIDTNNSGQGQKQIGFTFTDNIGVPYQIIDVDTNSIDVADVFSQGCPISGKIGIVHKSAYKGQSVHLLSNLLCKLHPIAGNNVSKFSLSILWGNSPNTRKINFTNVDQIAITDYRANLVDSEGITFNPYEDYPHPQFIINTVNEDGTYSEVFLGANKTYNETDGGLDSVIWSSTGDLVTGFIEISN